MKTYKPRIIVAAILLAAAWCLWYARPVNFRVLTGIQDPDYIDILVYSISEDEIPHSSFRLRPGDPDMETVLQELETLQFHRNPLDFVQKLGAKTGLLDGAGRRMSYDKSDYDIWIGFHEGDRHSAVRSFGNNNWFYEYINHYDIPISLANNSRGREFGTFLFEMRQARENSPAG